MCIYIIVHVVLWRGVGPCIDFPILSNHLKIKKGITSNSDTK